MLWDLIHQSLSKLWTNSHTSTHAERMSVTRVRPAKYGDSRDILDLHVSSIRAFGPDAYDDTEVEAWATTDDSTGSGYPIREEDHYFIVAETTDGIVGFGHLDILEREVTAVYVHPDNAGTGVGSALLASIEGFARGRNLSELRLMASLNAVGFYEYAGYEHVCETTHETSTGIELDCIEMKKRL